VKYLTSPGWYELNDTTEYNGCAVRLKPSYITTPEFKAKLDFRRSEVLKDIRRDGGMQVRNGKVERLWIQNGSGNVGVFNVLKLVLDYQPEGYDEKTPLGPRYIEVISIEDHERVVAELKAEVEYLKASRERLAQCELEALKRVEEKRQTIAKQAKVIEKLREQRDIELEDNCWDDASTGGRPFEQTRAMMEAEIEAINKLEDFKKV